MPTPATFDGIKDGSTLVPCKDATARSDISTLNNKIGSANGIAELDSAGKVPNSQLPSYVDDVLEYASQSAFPATGETGKIYIALDTNKTYRWSGSAYVEISESLALGETSSTAYAGNKGKANADAIAAMKDGSSIDSFGDVETALADKADTFGVDGWTIDWLTGIGVPDKLFVMEHDEIAHDGDSVSGLPNDEAVRKAVNSAYDLTKDTVGWTNINLMGYMIGKAYKSDTGLLIDDSHGAVSKIIPVSEGDKFIASKNATFSQNVDNMMCREYDSTGAFIHSTKVLTPTQLSNTYTVPSGVSYVGFVQFYNSGNMTQAILDTYEIMLYKAEYLATKYEPYRGTTAFPRDEQRVLGAKNLLPVTLTDVKTRNTAGTWSGDAYTFRGVTYTFEVDGGYITKVSTSGTATDGTSYLVLKYDYVFKAGMSYTLSGCGKYGQDVWVGLYNSATSQYGDATSKDGVDMSFGFDVDTTRQVRIRIGSGIVADNFVFYPMIRLATDADPTYAPYVMTNKELTNNVTELQDEVGHAGKNLLNNTATTQTINGVTYTVNADKTVSLSNTATANARLLVGSFTAKAGETYILTGAPNSADTSNYLGLYLHGETQSVTTDTGDGAVITANTDTLYDVGIRIKSGKDTSGMVFKPMVRHANIEDDTYYPYKMSIAEITDRVTPVDYTPTYEGNFTTHSATSFEYKKVGALKVVNAYIKGDTVTADTWTTLCTLPADMKPSTGGEIQLYGKVNGGVVVDCNVSAAGLIKIKSPSALTATDIIKVSGVYI